MYVTFFKKSYTKWKIIFWLIHSAAMIGLKRKVRDKIKEM